MLLGSKLSRRVELGKPLYQVLSLDPISCEDHEDEGQGEVQGAVLQVPLHPCCH